MILMSISPDFDTKKLPTMSNAKKLIFERVKMTFYDILLEIWD